MQQHFCTRIVKIAIEGHATFYEGFSVPTREGMGLASMKR